MSNLSHLLQQIRFSGHRQSFSNFSSFFTYDSPYCNIFNSLEIYILLAYDTWAVCTNIY